MTFLLFSYFSNYIYVSYAPEKTGLCLVCQYTGTMSAEQKN